MIKKSLLATLFATLCCSVATTAFAQEEPLQGVGTSLLNSANPRAAGMGMATTAVSDNAFGIFGNAAVNLSSEKRMGFGYSYNPVMPEFSKGQTTHAVGGYFNIDKNNGLSIGFRYYTGDEMALAGGDNTALGNVRAGDMAISLAYTRRIVDNFSTPLATSTRTTTNPSRASRQAMP